jgi:hypothetical protein
VHALDLQRRRDLGALLDTAFATWFRHFPVFFTLALMVVVPVEVLVDGVWAGTLGDFTPEDVPAGAWAVSTVCQTVVIPALVTAMHVVAVQDLGRDVRPTIRHSLAVAVRVFPHVSVVLVLYTLSVGFGLLLLLIPGIWLAVRWYFGLQAVVIEGERGAGALHRSGELVKGMWWRVFGVALVVYLFTLLFGLPLGLVGIGLDAAGADRTLIVGALQMLWHALGVSFTALIATLLFFDLRARTSEAPAEERFELGPERPQPA